jgi:hypothetical protein
MSVYLKAIEKWGERNQLEMLQEETTELSLARKLIRNKTPDTIHDFTAEIADVEIMIQQAKIMFPEIVEEVNRIKQFKLERLEKRLNKGVF